MSRAQCGASANERCTADPDTRLSTSLPTNRHSSAQAPPNGASGGCRMFKLIIAAVAACLLAAAPATAQDYPNKPIRLIVSFGPGGGADIVGRILGQAISEKLGQPVVIE